MAVLKGRRTEEIVPYREAKSSKKQILMDGRGKDASEKILAKGTIYLENDKRERKATGSYYTPDHIVQYIIENAVGPVIREKLEALRPKLREADRHHKEFFRREEALKKQGFKPEPLLKADLIGQDLVKGFFDITVCDPAMGSGHFLVEAVDFITDKTLDFLNSFPWNPVLVHLDKMRADIMSEMERQGITIDASRLTDVNLLKRQVLKKCIYGVDLNPMAVELAKVSLWLDCFTLGAPLSFLDHHLRCGNSLLGTTVEEVERAIEVSIRKEEKDLPLLSGLLRSSFTGLMSATELMREVGELSDLTMDQVRQSRDEYRKAADTLAPYKRILDVYMSQWFGNTVKVTKRKGNEIVLNPALDFLKSKEAQRWIKNPDAEEDLTEVHVKVIQTAESASRKNRFYHWELEFPEVFYSQGKRVDGAGFDVVVGNPPYDVLTEKEVGQDLSQELAFFDAHEVYEPAMSGARNLFKFFICKGTFLLATKGRFSMIVPMSLVGDRQAANVRKMLLSRISLQVIETFPQKDDPHRRVFRDAKLSTALFVAANQESHERPLVVRTHPAGSVDQGSPELRLSQPSVMIFDPEHAAIPHCTDDDWNIVTLMWNRKMQYMNEIVTLSEGEVHAQTHRKFIGLDKDGPVILRGASVRLYTIDEASQGEPLRLDVKGYLDRAREGTRAFAHTKRRLGFQRSSPQNNFRRIIGAIIEPGEFCFDTIKYVPEDASTIGLDVLLALLNSAILDWYFRLSSTNSKVNEYQFNTLPVPFFTDEYDASLAQEIQKTTGNWKEITHLLCEYCREPGAIPRHVAEAIAELSRQIQEIEGKRVLKNRSERSKLAPESQPIQNVIDDVLFHIYGLSVDEADHVRRRLKEML